jgi:hypothetical protein
MMSMISLQCNRAWFASISVPEIRLSARSPIEDTETLKWEVGVTGLVLIHPPRIQQERKGSVADVHVCANGSSPEIGLRSARLWD